MGIKENLFGRSRDSEFKQIQEQEKEKHFKQLKVARAREEGRKNAEYLANGGFFGMMGREINTMAKSGGKVAVKKMKAYAKTAKKSKSNKVDFLAPMRPMSMGEGYSTMPNIDNTMPDFFKKKRD